MFRIKARPKLVKSKKISIISQVHHPKLTAERRRDHLHLMRRRKSRARLLTNEELHKLQHFRKFLQGIGPHALIHRVLDIRRHERLHVYDENGVPAAKDVIR